MRVRIGAVLASFGRGAQQTNRRNTYNLEDKPRQITHPEHGLLPREIELGALALAAVSRHGGSAAAEEEGVCGGGWVGRWGFGGRVGQ